MKNNQKNIHISESKKAQNNFGSELLPDCVIKAFCEVKLAALRAAHDYDNSIFGSDFDNINEAINRLINLENKNIFKLSLLQGGSGTSLNMLFNETIAAESSLKGERRFDPIEDINIFQSTNDVLPTAMTIITLRFLNKIESLVIELQETLITLENKYSDILMCGRTEMQDALPITAGQIFSSWAGMIERDRWRLHKIKERLRTTALGGTAIGTGFSAPREYVFLAEKHLRTITGLPLSRSQNLCDEISNCDKYAEYASTVSLCMDNVFKIASDIILYSSSRFKEFILPEKQFGSSIMPFKTNPVIPEYVRGLSIFVKCESDKIKTYAMNGQLQLNQYTPFILHSIIELSGKTIDALKHFNSDFFNSIKLDRCQIEKNLSESKCLLNMLLPLCGYNELKDIYEKGILNNITEIGEFKKLLLEHRIISEKQIEHYLHPLNATSHMKEI